MKAGVVHAREDIRYEEIQMPSPKAGQVLIKVKYTGICGSDVPRVNGDACHFFPNVLGHEFSGVVEEIGDGVTSVKPGDRVSGVPLVPCMQCEGKLFAVQELQLHRFQRIRKFRGVRGGAGAQRGEIRGQCDI